MRKSLVILGRIGEVMGRTLPGKDEEKVIMLHIGFWTSALPSEKDDGKTAWMKGGIYLRSNKKRGIRGNGILFNNEKEFLSKFQKLLDKNGIKLLDLDAPHRLINLPRDCLG